MLYEYTNKEQELVAACFRVGNCFNLRDLPDLIGPNNVIQALKEKLEKAKALSALNAQNKKNYASLGKGNGMFQKFDWIPDNYSSCNQSILLKLSNRSRSSKKGKGRKIIKPGKTSQSAL